MQDLTPYTQRTEAKFGFARVHLDELRAYRGRGSGDAFERSHQESFLFHLLGALDAFYQELNVCYGCNLSLEDVNPKSLWSQLQSRGLTSPELKEIKKLGGDPTSWLGKAKEMRNRWMHRQDIARVFHVGGEMNGQVRLKHPKSGQEADGQEADKDYPDEFESWYRDMQSLLSRLRASAVKTRAHST